MMPEALSSKFEGALRWIWGVGEGAVKKTRCQLKP